MTPKEKATQLIYSFEAFTDRDNEYEFAKQCALIAVDEILEMDLPILEEDADEFYDYWEQAKKEINKL